MIAVYLKFIVTLLFIIGTVFLIAFNDQVTWFAKEMLVRMPGIAYRIKNGPTHSFIEVNWNDKLRNPYKPKVGTPNIILIVADDLGINDLSGGAGVATPNIDPIAHNGVRFENSYAAQTPSRAVLFRYRS